MRNVAGEIEGAKLAMQFCIDNHIEEIDIYYDYEGVEKWCTGVWKTNKSGTISYKQFYDEIKKSVKVSFNKVKGHKPINRLVCFSFNTFSNHNTLLSNRCQVLYCSFPAKYRLNHFQS